MSLFKEAKYELSLALEEKEARKIEVMRERRKARMDRLLDPRSRTMGLDVEYVKEQERVKALKAGEIAEETQREVQETQQQLNIVAAISRKEEQERKIFNRSILTDLQHQIENKELNDTWDLNDPKRIIKTVPARLGDDDPRLGPSSAQVFAGEDMMYHERKLLQQAQMRSWVAQVNAERQAVKDAEKQENLEFTKRTLEAAAYGDAIENQVQQLSKERQASTMKDNVYLIAEKAERKKYEKELEQHESMVTMQTLITPGAGMGILSESLGDAASSLGAHRVRGTYYRGRGSEYALKVQEGYREQIEAHKQHKLHQKELDNQIATEYAHGVREAQKVERKQAIDRAQAAINTRLALEQQIKDAQEARKREKEYYNKPGFGKDFFEAFGKTDK